MLKIQELIDASAKEATDFRIELQNHLIDSVWKAVRDYGATTETVDSVVSVLLKNRYMGANSRKWFTTREAGV
jgi:uncharacterized protein (DUF736 family)